MVPDLRCEELQQRDAEAAHKRVHIRLGSVVAAQRSPHAKLQRLHDSSSPLPSPGIISSDHQPTPMREGGACLLSSLLDSGSYTSSWLTTGAQEIAWLLLFPWLSLEKPHRPIAEIPPQRLSPDPVSLTALTTHHSSSVPISFPSTKATILRNYWCTRLETFDAQTSPWA